MSFRIIAIEPQITCNPDLRKVLQEDTIYYLYNNYEITGSSIRKLNSTVPGDIFHEGKNRSVNISAIVGRNGSGKSSLMDILYAVLFVASWKFDLLPVHTEKTKDDIRKINLHATVYFEQGEDEYYALRCVGARVQLFRQQGKEGRLLIMRAPDIQKIKVLFYTIVSNYSMFAFSPNSANAWLEDVFEKNDGYQLPLAINPFRENNRININTEDFLVRSRLLTNLLATGAHGEALYDELSPGRVVDNIKLSYRRDKMKLTGFPPRVLELLKYKRVEIISAVYKVFFDRKFSPNHIDKNQTGAVNYIILKLLKICTRYRPYQGKGFRFIDESKSQPVTGKTKGRAEIEYLFYPQRLYRLLEKIKANPSHITFKFYQTLNFILHYKFYNEWSGKLVKFRELRPAISNLARHTEKNLIDLVPAPIFNVEIQFKDRGYLHGLSSGEKQRIYNSSSWMYHLINLLSVKEDKEKKYNRYDSINIVFDEIELYYHPEMQRTFIKDFLESLNRLPLRPETAINCIFITHSPFILSDIPNENILFLHKDGEVDTNAGIHKTFGANIHELLQNNFFLERGTMGAYAQNLITDLIAYLKESKNPRQWKPDTVYAYIQLISEPIVRKSLLELYNVRFAVDRQLETQISELQKILSDRKNINHAGN
jgi:energy-coupling factor transporter ATP-binding protein EcfA2